MVDWGGKVAAWFGAVAAVSGTLAGLLAGTAKLPLHGRTHTLFSVLVAIAAASFIMLLLTGPPAMWAAWRRRKRSTQAGSADPAKPDPAEWVAACDETEDHNLVFSVRHLFENPGAILALGNKRCSVTDPDRIRTEWTGRPLYVSYHPANFPGAPPVRNGTYSYTWAGQDAKGTWHQIAAGTHDVTGMPALVVEITEHQFENWKYMALIAAMRVRITNKTGQTIRLRGIGFTHDTEGQPGWSASASGDDGLEMMRELHARRESQLYGMPLRNHAMVTAHEAISGWVVEAVTRPTAGAPSCTVIVEDTIGNKYTATLPKQEAQTYGP